MGFRFEPSLYERFCKIAHSANFTATGAFEAFMAGCVAANSLVFVERQTLDFESEARVLVDWLSKGKHLYRLDDGKEVNIQGRLLYLLAKVQNKALRGQIEDTLKDSVKSA